jgi:MoxR-like ATPase
MDRFSIRLSMGYPTEDEELSIMINRKNGNPMESVEAVVGIEDIKNAADAAAELTLAPEVAKYIVKLISATRKNQYISLGASPRATIALMKVSKTYAFLRGKDYVTPEDVSAVYKAVVSHRIVLGQEARLAGMSVSEVLDKVARDVDVPYKSGRS